MTKASLSDAVAAGIIDAEQAERLGDYLNNSERLSSNPDDETFRLILGFNDIFVSIGILLVFGPLSASPLLIAIGAWGLGEVFTIPAEWRCRQFFSLYCSLARARRQPCR